ncbi:MAG: hypothetical protein KKE20_01920 [Nanoarchaeota archaeon]|nr:hypothetical protein [Nanoarchaeota archaeon]
MRNKITAMIMIFIVISINFSSFVIAPEGGDAGESNEIVIDWGHPDDNAIQTAFLTDPQSVISIYPNEARVYLRANPGFTTSDPIVAEEFLNSVSSSGPISDPSDIAIAEDYVSLYYSVPSFEINGDVQIKRDIIISNGVEYKLDNLGNLPGVVKIVSPEKPTKGLVFVTDTNTEINVETGGDFEGKDGKFYFNGKELDFSGSNDQKITISDKGGELSVSCKTKCSFKSGKMDITLEPDGYYKEKGGKAQIHSGYVNEDGWRINGNAKFSVKDGKVDGTDPITVSFAQPPVAGAMSKVCYNSGTPGQNGKCAAAPFEVANVAFCLKCSAAEYNQLDKAVSDGSLSGYVFWGKTPDSKGKIVDSARARGDFLANFNHDLVRSENKNLRWDFVNDNTGNSLKFDYQGSYTDERLGSVMAGGATLELKTEKDDAGRYSGVHVERERIAHSFLKTGPELIEMVAGDDVYYKTNSAFYTDLLLNPNNIDFDKSKPGVNDIDPAYFLSLVVDTNLMTHMEQEMSNEFSAMFPDLFQSQFNAFAVKFNNGDYGEDVLKDRGPINMNTPPMDAVGTFASLTDWRPPIHLELDKVPGYGNVDIAFYNDPLQVDNNEATWLSHETFKYTSDTGTDQVPVINLYFSKGQTTVIEQNTVLESGLFRAFLNIDYSQESFRIADSNGLKGDARNKFVSNRMNQLHTELVLEERYKELANLVEYVDDSSWIGVKAAKEWGFGSREEALAEIKSMNGMIIAAEDIQKRRDKDPTLTLAQIRSEAMKSNDKDTLRLFTEPSINMQMYSEKITPDGGKVVIWGKEFDLSDPQQRANAISYNLMTAAELYHQRGDYDQSMEYYVAMVSLSSDDKTFVDVVSFLPKSFKTDAPAENEFSGFMRAYAGSPNLDPGKVLIDGEYYYLPPELHDVIEANPNKREMILNMVKLQDDMRNDEGWKDTKEFMIDFIPDDTVDVVSNVAFEFKGLYFAAKTIGTSALKLAAKETFLAGMKGVAGGTFKAAAIGLVGVGGVGGAEKETLEQFGKKMFPDLVEGEIDNVIRLFDNSLDNAARTADDVAETASDVVRGTDDDFFRWLDNQDVDEIVGHGAGSYGSEGGRIFESGVVSADDWRRTTVDLFENEKTALIDASTSDPSLFPDDTVIHMTSTKNLDGISGGGLRMSDGAEGVGVYTGAIDSPEKLGLYSTSAAGREGAAPAILRVNDDGLKYVDTPNGRVFREDIPPDRIEFWDSSSSSWKPVSEWSPADDIVRLPSEDSLSFAGRSTPERIDLMFEDAVENSGGAEGIISKKYNKYRELGYDDATARKMAVAAYRDMQ